MDYKVIGDTFPAVVITLNRGEKIVTQAGGMSWMSGNIEMTTSTRGGLGKGVKRALAGESIFQATYTAKQDNEHITCAATMPGKIIDLYLDGEREYIAQKGAFLAGEESVNMDMFTVKKISSALFGGQGIFLLKLSGKGTAFLEIGGHLEEYNLGVGEVIKVNTGNVAFFESSVNYEVETVKGAKNILFGGEGLFLTKLTGPGKVYLQTMNMGELAGALSSYIPTT